MTPGQALTAELQQLSVYTAGSCACRSVAARMDLLGLTGCQIKRDELAAQLKHSAAAAGYARTSLDHFADVVDRALAAAEAALPKRAAIHSLAVITSFFNPARFRQPLANYHRFAAGIRNAGVPLHTIELVFDDAPFELTADVQIRGSRERHQLWQKERLLNLLIAKFGPQYDALAWIDADILFPEPDWPAKTTEALRRWPVVQLFSDPARSELLGTKKGAYDCLPGGKLKSIRPSTAYLWQRQDPRASNLNQSHPGYAWAGRSDWLLAHGLEELTITGGGDCVMMKAFQRNASVTCSTGINFDAHFGRPWKEAIRRWVEPVAAAIAGQLGYVDTCLWHLWHGDGHHRRYLQRWHYLIDGDYDPARDVETDPETGLLTWSELALRHKPRMVQQIRDYFALRREDG